MHTLLAQSFQIPWTNPSGGDTEKSINGNLQGGTFNNSTGQITIGGILSSAIQFVFIFAGVGLFIMLLAGGFTFLTSAGDTKKLEQGRQQLTNALIGFIIIFVAFWLVQALGYMLGLSTFTGIFG